MESDKVEKLLKKYFEATTTVAEEASLRDYFSGDEIAVHLEHYAALFQYFEVAREEQSTQPVQLDSEKVDSILSESMGSHSGSLTSPAVTKSRRLWYTWGTVAAMVLIMVGVYFSFDTASTLQQSDDIYASLQDEYTKEEIATAQEALALLSTKFSEGTQQLSHLNEFEKNTNRFLNEKQ